MGSLLGRWWQWSRTLLSRAESKESRGPGRDERKRERIHVLLDDKGRERDAQDENYVDPLYIFSHLLVQFFRPQQRTGIIEHGTTIYHFLTRKKKKNISISKACGLTSEPNVVLCWAQTSEYY